MTSDTFDVIALKALVDTYLTRWNARDFPGMAALFSEPSAMIHGGALIATAETSDVEDGLRKRFAAMDADGFDHTEIGRVEVEMVNAETALVHLLDLRRLRADGSVMDAFDGLYLCTKTALGWKLAVGVAGAPGWRTPSS